MKRMMMIVIFLGILLLAAVSCTRNPYPGYELVWSDEFDIDGTPDSEKWTYEYGFVRNQEDQWYQPDNAYIKDGYLFIEGKREQIENPNYDPDSKDWRLNREFADYTSTAMTTKGINSWQYGIFEMRARIDVRDGSWPAFWTLGENIDEVNWPGCGEVDIMEYYDGKLLFNVAWRKWTDTNWWGANRGLSRFDEGWANEFHIWRMEWDEEFLKLYLDDELMNTVPLEYAFNDGDESDQPFNQPHFIIINQAIGGTVGGDPSNTETPFVYQVDYVRVYQKK